MRTMLFKRTLSLLLCLLMLTALLPVGALATNTDPINPPADTTTTCEHSGGEATCTALAKCVECGEEYGELAGHKYVNGTCTACGGEDPNYVPPVFNPPGCLVHTADGTEKPLCTLGSFSGYPDGTQLYFEFNGTTSAVPPTAIKPGVYEVSYSLVLGDKVEDHGSITSTIYPAAEPPATSSGLVYSGQEQLLAHAAADSKVSLGGETWSDTVSATNAGDHTVYYKTTVNGVESALGSTTVSIAKLPITASYSGTIGKEFDASANAALEPAQFSFSGLLEGMNVTLNSVTASYASDAPGTQTVSVTDCSFTVTLNGADVTNNCSLSFPGMSGTITPIVINLSNIKAEDKVYDGTTTATVNAESCIIEDWSMKYEFNKESLTGSFADADVGEDKPITLSGYKVIERDTTKYVTYGFVVTADLKASITKAVPGGSISSRTETYNGSYQELVKNEVEGGTVYFSLGTETAPGSQWDTAIPTAKDAGTYYVWYKVKGDKNHSDIGGKCVPVTIDKYWLEADTIDFGKPLSKVYDGTSTLTATFYGTYISGEKDPITITFKLTDDEGNPVSDVGSGYTAKIEQVEANDNYAPLSTLFEHTLEADIVPRELSIQISATDRVYNGRATVSLSLSEFSGLLPQDKDQVSVESENFYGEMDDASAGENKKVSLENTDITLTGAKAKNYSLSWNEETTVNISPKPLTVHSITAKNRDYDGSTKVELDEVTFTGLVDAETVSFDTSDYTATAAKADVGENIAVTVSGLKLAGDAAKNYTLSDNSGSTTVTITPRTVKPSVSVSDDKLSYNGKEQKPAVTLTVKVGDEDLVIPAAEYELQYSDNVNAGTATVNVKDNAGGNYEFDEKVISQTFTIGKAALTAAPQAVSVTKGAKTPSLNLMVSGLISGDEKNVKISPAPVFKVYTSAGKEIAAAEAVKTVGSYTIKWENMNDVAFTGIDNYELTRTQTAKFEVKKPVVNATTSADSGYYYYTAAPVTTSYTVPISGDEKTINVKATVKGGTATIDEVSAAELDKVIGEDVETGTVTIDFTRLNTRQTITRVEIPADSVKAITEAVHDEKNDAESLEIILGSGRSIEFDSAALAEKVAQAKGEDITISIIHTDYVPNLTDAQREVVGKREAYDINVYSGGKHISDMGGKITVHVPYVLKPGEDAAGLRVWYVDENGERELCESSYDKTKKRVNFVTDHLSLYMIDYEAQPLPAEQDEAAQPESQPVSASTAVEQGSPAEDIGNEQAAKLLPWILLLLLSVLGAALGVALLLRRKKEN